MSFWVVNFGSQKGYFVLPCNCRMLLMMISFQTKSNQKGKRQTERNTLKHGMCEKKGSCVWNHKAIFIDRHACIHDSSFCTITYNKARQICDIVPTWVVPVDDRVPRKRPRRPRRIVARKFPVHSVYSWARWTVIDYGRRLYY